MADGRDLFNELWGVYQKKMSSDKVSALDFAEVVTYLLFLKMDDERSQRPIGSVRVVPVGLGWQSLFHRRADVLEDQFRHVVAELGKRDPDPRTLIRQTIFRDAAPILRCTPAALSYLMTDVINQRRWSPQGNAVLHDMYAALLEKASERFQLPSGQMLTPLPLASAVVDCLGPTSADIVRDPACGTGSLLVAAQHSMAQDGVKLEASAVTGADFDPIMCRFATMNYLLSTGAPFDSAPPVHRRNSLAEAETDRPTLVVCNPPFRSVAPLPGGRTDLWARSGSMPLNFLQHIARGLPIGGRAAVFVPDNVLFMSGPELNVRHSLLRDYDVHTLLRLPTGVFTRSNAKSNVLFFDAVRPSGDGTPATSQVWIYDLRSGRHFQARENPIAPDDLKDFIECFGIGEPRAARTATERFKPVSYEQLIDREFNVDILWRDDAGSEVARSPREIILEIAGELNAAVEEFTALADELPEEEPVGEP